MEAAVVSGIAFSRDEAKIIAACRTSPASPPSCPVAAANIDVDMIVQNQSVAGTTDFVHREPQRVRRAVDLLKREVIRPWAPRAVHRREGREGLHRRHRHAFARRRGQPDVPDPVAGRHQHPDDQHQRDQDLGDHRRQVHGTGVRALHRPSAWTRRPPPRPEEQGSGANFCDSYPIPGKVQKVVLESLSLRRRAREAEGAPLLREYVAKTASRVRILRLRQTPLRSSLTGSKKTRNSASCCGFLFQAALACLACGSRAAHAWG